ncbi:DUF1064 domain-containing protein [Metabacillus litoralis]|uniref:DUF1064 domain-containing protein n=1 Tax=Metabacillus litoralis TaxID=152268 RepID=UPI00203E4485|nr:DUF1064 domain-containing protein [Metabacillus litoralis]MCM3651306.1 DUF1064 domain-containing protein [Metabacillus litoralis]
MAINKFGAKKTIVDNITFDSKSEAQYYQQLKWLQQAKQIKSFKLQPKFLLQEAFKKNGKTFRKIEYIADFEIHNLDGSIEVVDVKGVETEAFKIKRKLFEKLYPHNLSLITYEPAFGGWIELEELKKLKRKPRKKASGRKIGKPKT